MKTMQSEIAKGGWGVWVEGDLHFICVEREQADKLCNQMRAQGFGCSVIPAKRIYQVSAKERFSAKSDKGEATKR